MTKVLEWLCLTVLFLSLWVSLLTKKITHRLLDENPFIVTYLPIISILLFGLYATVVVLWRVYTFNNCEEAAAELKEEIKEARANLKARGFQFKEEKT